MIEFKEDTLDNEIKNGEKVNEQKKWIYDINNEVKKNGRYK